MGTSHSQQKEPPYNQGKKTKFIFLVVTHSLNLGL